MMKPCLLPFLIVTGGVLLLRPLSLSRPDR